MWGIGLALGGVGSETGQAHMISGNYRVTGNGDPSVWLL